MFIYFWERDKVQAGEGQREMETESEAGSSSELSVQSLMQGSNLRTLRPWPEPKLVAQPAELPRRPWAILIMIVGLGQADLVLYLDLAT